MLFFRHNPTTVTPELSAPENDVDAAPASAGASIDTARQQDRLWRIRRRRKLRMALRRLRRLPGRAAMGAALLFAALLIDVDVWAHWQLGMPFTSGFWFLLAVATGIGSCVVYNVMLSVMIPLWRFLRDHLLQQARAYGVVLGEFEG